MMYLRVYVPKNLVFGVLALVIVAQLWGRYMIVGPKDPNDGVF